MIETQRKTKETEISLKFGLYGKGQGKIDTPLKFLNHMLEQVMLHGKFDIELSAKSLDSDPHHIVEDIAIVLGKAFLEALGDKKGISRYSSVFLPMDEAICQAVVDISGRPFCKCTFDLKDERTSDFDTVLLPHFYNSFAQNAGITLHIRQIDGYDTHHIIEASFKAFARALRAAAAIDVAHKDEIPSTKGTL